MFNIPGTKDLDCAKGSFYIPDFLLSHHGQPAMGYLIDFTIGR
jgi:hypothetical protein